MTALTDAVKDEIQIAYRTWLAARDFKPRRGQRQMIAAIARSLSANWADSGKRARFVALLAERQAQ